MSTKKAAKKTVRKPVRKAGKRPAKKAASSEMCRPSPFHWNELQTTDANAAKVFYTKLFGWTTEPFGSGMDYTILLQDDKGFGGIMQGPHPGAPAQWIGYVVVKDVDAIVAKLTKLGGKVCAPPFDIPGVGRISVVQDPQGATFGVHAPKM